MVQEMEYVSSGPVHLSISLSAGWSGWDEGNSLAVHRATIVMYVWIGNSLVPDQVCLFLSQCGMCVGCPGCAGVMCSGRV